MTETIPKFDTGYLSAGCRRRLVTIYGAASNFAIYQLSRVREARSGQWCAMHILSGSPLAAGPNTVQVSGNLPRPSRPARRRGGNFRPTTHRWIIPQRS